MHKLLKLVLFVYSLEDRMLSKLKISHKVYGLGLIQLSLMLITGLYASIQMNNIGQELVAIAEADIPATGKITEITELQLQQAILFEKALFKAALAELNDDKAKTEFNQLNSAVADKTNKIEQHFKETKRFIGDIINKISDPITKEKLRENHRLLTDIERNFLDLSNEMASALSKVSTQSVSAISDEISKVEAHEKEIESDLIKLLSEIHNFTLASALKAEEHELDATKTIMYLFVIAVLISAILPLIIAKSITQPIVKLQQGLEQASKGDGDLTFRLDDKNRDETGDAARAFNHYLSTQQSLIKSIIDQGNQLSESSKSASVAMHETVDNFRTQQAETDTVASAIEQLSIATKEISQNAQQASTFTDNVKSKVTDGTQGALATKDDISQLTQQINNASKVIESLVIETNSIDSVLETIQSIAEQTNLLALNAAIEAARAGESGRGFAVVADEVRSLAQRTQTSTVDIQELVHRLQAEAKNAVDTMEQGKDLASTCLEKSLETANLFEQANEAANSITELTIQIAASVEEQSVMAQEVSQNVINISDISDNSAQLATSSSKLNNDIEHESQELIDKLNRFKI